MFLEQLADVHLRGLQNCQSEGTYWRWREDAWFLLEWLLLAVVVVVIEAASATTSAAAPAATATVMASSLEVTSASSFVHLSPLHRN